MLHEILLVAAVIYHGVNGLKIILNDTFPQWWQVKHERTGFWKVAIITFVLWLPAAYLMSRSLYLNNICHCAPVTTRTAEQIAASTNLSLIIVPIAFFAILAVLALGGKLASPIAPGARGGAAAQDLRHLHLAVHALERRAAHPAGLDARGAAGRAGGRARH